MRIPCTIEKNTFEVYKKAKDSNKKFPVCTIKSDDFQWDSKIPAPLQTLCVQCIADNWKDFPILEEILSPTDKSLLLDILPLDLPFDLTIPRIDYDIYWKRCYQNRWPNQLPESYTIKTVDVSGSSPKTINIKRFSSITNGGSTNTEESHMNERRDEDSLDSFKNSGQASNGDCSKSSSNDESNKTDLKTWKQYYLEMHVKHFLENLKPEGYDAEQIKELTDLCNSYVQNMNIDQLLCAANSANRIPLNAVLTGFPYLRELSLCFKQTYVGEKFSWNVVNVSMQDVTLLAKGLEKCNLRCFRLTNSDIDSEKSIIIFKALTRNRKIRIVDFSHCNIENRGAYAVSKFCSCCPVEELILTNNKIGSAGAQAIAYAVSQPACEVTRLQLRLNSIRDEGANFLFHVLSSNNTKVTHLDLSACDITGHIQTLTDVLKFNGRLHSMKLSNNKLGEEIGKDIVNSLTSNWNIRILDIRMCNISSDLECRIRNQLESNKQRKDRHNMFLMPEQSGKPYDDFDDEVINDVEYILE